ncbi:MAG TPA: DUF2630 family protein [Mycobacteriales bacterium]|jgi:hypothetical protein|nr:DUF2630 family protein [Mycobacteriales bacterium]
MDDREILAAVRALVDKEHALRSRMEAGGLDAAEEQQQLAELEHSLDQCWDLLRQRRARHDAGQNPDDAAVRDVRTVEGYRQ